MSGYKNILVAIDGSEESVVILARAMDLIGKDNVKLNVVLVF